MLIVQMWLEVKFEIKEQEDHSPEPYEVPSTSNPEEDDLEVNVGNQRQGESIALNPEGTFYLTHSEYVNETIWKYNIIQEDGVLINVSQTFH